VSAPESAVAYQRRHSDSEGGGFVFDLAPFHVVEAELPDMAHLVLGERGTSWAWPWTVRRAKGLAEVAKLVGR